MRHLMPIVTPRLVLRPPTLGDLDSIQTAKEDAWPDLQRWMAWAFDNERPRQAMANSIRRTMDYQDQAGIALAGFHKINGDFVVRTALDLTDDPNVYETGYWVAPKYARQGMATEAANAAIRYAFGHLGAKAISIGYFDGNQASRRIDIIFLYSFLCNIRFIEIVGLPSIILISCSYVAHCYNCCKIQYLSNQGVKMATCNRWHFLLSYSNFFYIL